MEKIIFNSSLPKCGSELLQVVLHQNPKIYASTTSPLFDFIYGASRNLRNEESRSIESDILHKSFINGCRGMVKGYCETLTDRPIFLDKCRSWSHYYNWIKEIQTKPKMICMVRDIRSIVASFERTYQAHRFSPQCPDDHKTMANIALKERVNHYLNSRPLNIALKRLDDLFQTGVSDKILFVCYEDFCNHSQEMIGKIYEYLEEEKYVHDFNNIKKVVNENNSAFGIFGNHQVRKSLNLVGEKPWSDVLNDDISRNLHNSMINHQNRFHYQL